MSVCSRWLEASNAARMIATEKDETPSYPLSQKRLTKPSPFLPGAGAVRHASGSRAIQQHTELPRWWDFLDHVEAPVDFRGVLGGCWRAQVGPLEAVARGLDSDGD